MELIADSLTKYFNDSINFSERVYGYHHQAIIGLFCHWWLAHGEKLGYQFPALMTGLHAGRRKGEKTGGSVADNLFAHWGGSIIGMLEVEVAAGLTTETIVPQLNKTCTSIKKHKKDYPELQWAITFQPAWDEKAYIQKVKQLQDLVRQKQFAETLDALSQKLGIVIFNCTAQAEFSDRGTGPMLEAQWGKLEVTVHKPGT